jgi:2-dehydro-3-deoxy-D-arabinonate dehydratase
MKLYQYDVDGKRAVVADDGAGPAVVPGLADVLTLLTAAGPSGEAVAAFVAERWRAAGRRPLAECRHRGPWLPLAPPEVWAFGVTYRRSAADREQDAGAAGDIYARAHAAARPEAFFKATASRCVGPGEAIGIRGDSALTAPEPELAYVVGRDNAIVAYTLANDVSAWDLERENPLYLPQSKIYAACCALGPCLVTAGALEPAAVEIMLTIRRGGEVVFEGSANTSLIRHPIAHLHDYLTRYNPVPVGTVALTGTGIMTPAGFALAAGDEVVIEAEPFGQLVNRAKVLT